MQTPGSFQVTMAGVAEEQAVQKPNVAPGAGNPQMGSVAVRAMKGNLGVIYVGPKGVTAATGFELAAGDIVNMDITSLGGLYAIGTKAGDKLCVFFVGP